MSQDWFVNAFREAAPYIHYLRGKTLVVGLASPLLQGQTLASVAADLNLLAALGIKLVLVHGSNKQINDLCEQNQYTVQFYQQRRLCDAQVLQWAKQACGQLQFDLQAALSVGVAHTLQKVQHVRVVGGNVVTAKPLGVIDGIDMGYTGEVRKVDAAALSDYLAQQAVVLISPMGVSLSGQCYHLMMAEVAAEVAAALRAEKLIFLTEWDGIVDADNNVVHELTADQAQTYLQFNHPQNAILRAAIQALSQDISRVQVLSGSLNGGLLRELFTREGVGTSIANTPFMSIRAAQEGDIADLLALTQPLEAQGVLMQRSQRYLTEHIHEFYVLEHDRQIDGCVALKLFGNTPEVAELACLVVSPDARKSGYGDLLLKHVVGQATLMGKKQLFALSTHTSDWFMERGFQACSVHDLPPQRQQEYHENGRHSRVFVMNLV